MTILEASNDLINWFKNNDSFNIKDNYNRLYPNRISESKEADLSCVKCALTELEKDNIVRSSKIEDQEYWTLIQPFNVMPQNVSISYDAAIMLAEVGKQLSEHLGSKSFTINANKISEQDILLIVSSLFSIIKKQNEE